MATRSVSEGHIFVMETMTVGTGVMNQTPVKKVAGVLVRIA